MSRPLQTSVLTMRRVEEILEIDEIVNEAADSLATVLERSGAGELYPLANAP